VQIRVNCFVVWEIDILKGLIYELRGIGLCCIVLVRNFSFEWASIVDLWYEEKLKACFNHEVTKTRRKIKKRTTDADRLKSERF
jgi:hypothetical protein